jgi:hypothetical protein
MAICPADVAENYLRNVKVQKSHYYRIFEVVMLAISIEPGGGSQR